MIEKKEPNKIDVIMGLRVRKLRMERGISQSKLADAMGLTFQQVQKYERAANRMGSSRLFQISQAFGITVSELFKDIEKDVGKPVPETLQPTRLNLEGANKFKLLNRPNKSIVKDIMEILIETQPIGKRHN